MSKEDITFSSNSLMCTGANQHQMYSISAAQYNITTALSNLSSQNGHTKMLRYTKLANRD